MTSSSIDFETLLISARDGSDSALGDLLGRYRKLLKTLVRAQMLGPMQAKADASDVVQEALFKAVNGFAQFRGSSEQALISWLRSIVASQLAILYRHHYAARRTIHLERRLDAALEQSSIALQSALHSGTSPSAQLVNHEELITLANALESLPEHYRTVIVLRHMRGEHFKSIGEQMGRSTESVRKLWVRGLAELKLRMEAN